MPITPPPYIPQNLREWTRFFQGCIVEASSTPNITDADIPATIARDSEVTAGDAASVATAAAALAAHVAAADPHPTYTTAGEVTTAIAAASITEAQITDGAILARVAASETITGAYNFSTLPPRVTRYTVATLPSAATYQDGLITVSDETGGYVLAFSDGTNWRRVTDRAVVA